MVSRRWFLAALACALLVGATAQPAVARRPAPQPPLGQQPPPIVAPPAPPQPPLAVPPVVEPSSEPLPEPPLTVAERAAAAVKEAAAERFAAATAGATDDLASLACVPYAAPTESNDEATLETVAPLVVSQPEPLNVVAGCTYTPQGFLAVEARDQINGWYCGPAVGQVISNYSWAVPAGTNAFAQQRLAEWMATDLYGGTSAWYMQRGLDVATAGSPRQPANWDWIVSTLWDSDGDGWSGDQLDAYVRTNISGSGMPLAVSVKPHDANAPNGAHLASWPNAVQSVGHWVAIYGWYRIHDGSDRARMYFTDSSRDEGGGTGKYWTSTWWFTIMILDHTRSIVW